jgi:hypothetical protein
MCPNSPTGVTQDLTDYTCPDFKTWLDNALVPGVSAICLQRIAGRLIARVMVPDPPTAAVIATPPAVPGD